jgi:hypothetical protein
MIFYILKMKMHFDDSFHFIVDRKKKVKLQLNPLGFSFDISDSSDEAS